MRQPVNSVQSGLTLFVSGLLLHRFSPNLFGQKTPLLHGDSAWNAFVSVGILTLILIPLLDFLSGPRGKKIVGAGVHKAAVEWLNRSELFMTGGQPDRLQIILACFVSAVGEATLFHYAFLTLVPPLGELDQFFTTPVPTGHIMSVPLYAWYKGGDDGEMTAVFGVAGAFYAMASLEGGLVAAAALNFIASVAMVSLYLYGRMRDKERSRKETQRGSDGGDKDAQSKTSGAPSGGKSAGAGSTKKRK